MAGHYSSSAEVDWKLINYEPNNPFPFDCPVKLHQKNCNPYRTGPSQEKGEVADWSLINVEPAASQEISSKIKGIEPVPQPDPTASNITSGPKQENDEEVYASGSRSAEDWTLINAETPVFDQCRKEDLKSYDLDDVEPGPSNDGFSPKLQNAADPTRTHLHKDMVVGNVDNQHIQRSSQEASSLHEHRETCFETDHELPGSSKPTKVVTILKRSSTRMDPESDAAEWKRFRAEEPSNIPRFDPDCWSSGSTEDFNHESHEKESKKHVHFDSTSEYDLFNKEPHIQYRFPKEKCAAAACGQTLCRMRESVSNKTRFDLQIKQPSNISEKARETLGFANEKGNIQLIIPFDGNKNMSANEDSKDVNRYNQRVSQLVGDFTSLEKKPSYQRKSRSQCPQSHESASNSPNQPDILNVESVVKKKSCFIDNSTIFNPKAQEAVESHQHKLGCRKTQSHTEKMVALFTKLQSEQSSQPLPLEKTKRRRHTEGVAAERARDLEEKIAKVADETSLASHPVQKVEKILSPAQIEPQKPELQHANTDSVKAILLVLNSMQSMLMRMAKMANSTDDDHNPATWKTFLKSHTKISPYKLSCSKEREMIPDGLFAYSIAHQVVGQALKKISELYPECAEKARTESSLEKENAVEDSVPTVLALTAMKETLKDLEGSGTDKSYASTAVETSNSLASVTAGSDPEEDQRDQSTASESEEVSLSLIDDCLLETNNSDEQKDAEKVVSDVLRDGILSKQSDPLQELKQMSFELVSRTMKEALGVLMTSEASETTRCILFDKYQAATPMHSEEAQEGSISREGTNREEQSQNSPVAEISRKRDDQSVAYFMQSISDEVHGLIRKLFNHLQSVESKEELNAMLSATKADSSISVDTVFNSVPICTTPESDVSSLDTMTEGNSTSLTTMAGKSGTFQKAHTHRRDTAADLGNVKQQLQILSMKTEPQNEYEENHSQPLSLSGKFELAPSASAQELPPEGAQEQCPLRIDVMPSGNGSNETSNDSTKCLNSRSQSVDSSIERLFQMHTAATHSRITSRDNLLTYDAESQGSSPYTTPSTLLSQQTSGDSRDQMFSSTGFGGVQLVRSEDLLHIPSGRLSMAGGNHPEHVQQADLNRPMCTNPTKKPDHQSALQSGAFVSKSERERVREGKRQHGSSNCAGACHHQQRGSKFSVGNAARHKLSASEPRLDFYRRTNVLPCPQVRRNLLENPDISNSDWTLVGWFPPRPNTEALHDASCEINNENIFTEGEGVISQETEVFGTMAASSQQTTVNWPSREESDPVDDCLEPVSTKSSEQNCRDSSNLSDNPQTLAAVNWNKSTHGSIERVYAAVEENAEHRKTNGYDHSESETFRETPQSGRVNPTPNMSKRTTNELSEEHHTGSSGCLQYYSNSAAQNLSSAVTSSDQLSENTPLSDCSHYCQQTRKPEPFMGNSGSSDQNILAPSIISNGGQLSGACVSPHRSCDNAQSGNISPTNVCPHFLNTSNTSCASTYQPVPPTSCSRSCCCQSPLFREVSGVMNTGPFPCAIKENLAECSNGEISSSDNITSCKCSAVNGQNPGCQNKNINGIGRVRNRYEPYPKTWSPKPSCSGGTSVDALQHDILQLNDRMERGMEAIKSTVTSLCEAMHYPYAERRNSTALEIKEALSFQTHASNGLSSRVHHCSTHSCDVCSVHSPEKETGLESSYGSVHHPGTRDFAMERKAAASVDLETLSVSNCCSVTSNRSRDPILSISVPGSKWRHHCHRLPGMMRDEQHCSSFHETACSDVCHLAVDPASASYGVPRNVRIPTPCHCQSYSGHCCSLFKTGSCCVDRVFGTNTEDISKAVGTPVSRSSVSKFKAVSKTSVQGCAHAPPKYSPGFNDITLPNHQVSENGYSASRVPSQAICKCMCEGRLGHKEETRESVGCKKTSTCVNPCDSAKDSFIDVDGFAEISRKHINPVLAERVQKLMRKDSAGKTAITSKCSSSTHQECEYTTESLESSKVKGQLADDDVTTKTHESASAKGSEVQVTRHRSPKTVPSSEVDAAFRVIHSILNSCDSGSTTAPVCMKVTSSNMDKCVANPSTHFKFELAELLAEVPSSDLPFHTDKSNDKNGCCVASESRDSSDANSSVDNSASKAQFFQQNAPNSSTGQPYHGGDNEDISAPNPNKLSAFFVSVDQENGPPAFFVQSVPQTSTMKEFTDIACQVSNENFCSSLQEIPAWYESDSSEVSLCRSISLSKITDLDRDFYGNPEDLTCRDKATGYGVVAAYVTPDKDGSSFSRSRRVSAKNQLNIDCSRSRGVCSPLSRTTTTNSSILEGVCEISHSGCETCVKKEKGCSSRSRLRVTSSRSLTCERHLSQGLLSRRSSSTSTGLDPLQIPSKDTDVHYNPNKSETQLRHDVFTTSNKNSHSDGRWDVENTDQVFSCVGVNVIRTGNAAPYYAVTSASDSVDPSRSSSWAADTPHLAQVENHPEPTMLRTMNSKLSHADHSNTAINTGTIGEDSCGKQNIQNNMDDASHNRTSLSATPRFSEKSAFANFSKDSDIPVGCQWMSSESGTESSSSKASCLLSRQSGAIQHDLSWESNIKASIETPLPPDPVLAATDGEEICRTPASSNHGAAHVEAFSGECSHFRKRLQQSRSRLKPSRNVLEPHEEEPPFSLSPCSSPSLQSLSLMPHSNYSYGTLSQASSRVDPFLGLYDPTWLNGLDSERTSSVDPSSLPKPVPIPLYDASYVPRTMKSGTGVDLNKGLDDILGGSTGVDTKAGTVDNADLLIRSISEELCVSPSWKQSKRSTKEDSWAALQKMNLNSRATRMVLESRLKSLHRLLKKMESSENMMSKDMPNKQQTPVSKTSSRETVSSISASHPTKGYNWLKACNSEELVQVVEHQLKGLKDNSAITDLKSWNKSTDNNDL